MKYLKFILGVTGTLLLVMIVMLLAHIFISIISFLFSLLLFKAIVTFIWSILLCFGVYLFLFVGYYATIDLLERHFKFFKKDDK